MTLVFDGGITQRIATYTEHERDLWLEAIQVHSYNHVRSQLLSLQEQLESKQAHDPDLDVQMWRIRKGHHSLSKATGFLIRYAHDFRSLCTNSFPFSRRCRVTSMRNIFVVRQFIMRWTR